MPSKRALLSALLLALTWAMLLPSPSLAQRACIKGETGSPEFWYFEVLQLCHNCQCYVRICLPGCFTWNCYCDATSLRVINCYECDAYPPLHP